MLLRAVLHCLTVLGGRERCEEVTGWVEEQEKPQLLGALDGDVQLRIVRFFVFRIFSRRAKPSSFKVRVSQQVNHFRRVVDSNTCNRMFSV